MDVDQGAMGLEEAARYCVGCGYNLRGVLSDRCPECGLEIDASNASIVAWEHRKRLGRWRAFWGTAWMATFRPERLAEAVDGAVSYRAARRFRWVVVVLAALPVMAFVVALVFMGKGLADDWGTQIPFAVATPERTIFWRIEAPAMWANGAKLDLVLPIGFLFTFLIGTGGWGRWILSRGISVEKQNRVIALGNYVCAPLVFVFLPTGMLAATVAIEYLHLSWTAPYSVIFLAAALGLICSGVLISLLYWRNSVTVLSSATGAGRGRRVVAALALPMRWYFAAVVGIVAWPMVVGLLWLMGASVR
jgi:hypothetical protein